VPGGGDIAQANNNQRLVHGRMNSDSVSNYLYWDGTGFFPFPETTKPVAGYGVGSAAHPWDNLYINNLYSPNSMTFYTGGSTQSLTLSSTAVLPGDNNMALGSLSYPWGIITASGAIRTTLSMGVRRQWFRLSEDNTRIKTIDKNCDITPINFAGYTVVRVDVTFQFSNSGTTGVGEVRVSSQSDAMLQFFKCESAAEVTTTITLSFVVAVSSININIFSNCTAMGGDFINLSYSTALITGMT